jgi:hypothetical protein
MMFVCLATLASQLQLCLARRLLPQGLSDHWRLVDEQVHQPIDVSVTIC